MKLTFKKTAALLMVLTLVLTMFAGMTVAMADNALIDKTEKGSITVHKYATLTYDTTVNPATLKPAPKPGTGMDGQTVPGTAGEYKSVAKVQFKLYKIGDVDDVMDYYSGAPKTLYEPKVSMKDAATITYGPYETDENGVLVFGKGSTDDPKLDIGFYVLEEVSAPEQITATPRMDPCVISIPMVNSSSSSNKNNASWTYDVHVYPKNHESRGNVELTKLDSAGTPIPGVEFELVKIVNNTPQPIEVYDNKGQLITYTLITGSDEATKGKLSLKDLPSGENGTLYRLTEVSAPAGYTINKTPIYFTVNPNNTITWESSNQNTSVTNQEISETTPNLLTLTVENPMPGIEKTVKVPGTTENWGHEAEYESNKTIEYKITLTNIPHNTKDMAAFDVKDVPSGIKVETTSIAVTVDGEELAKTFYTVTQAANENGFTLQFTAGDQGGKVKISDAAKVVITYTASLTVDATINGNGNVNSATLTYSKEAQNASSENYTITDKAVVYTYKHKFVKQLDTLEKNTDGTAKYDKGAGVHFLLLDKNGTQLDVCQVEEGVYRLKLPTDTSAANDLVTDTNGNLTIQGLTNEVYKLKETQTVQGYNLLSDVVTFCMGEFAADGSPRGNGRTTTWDDGATPPKQDFSKTGDTSVDNKIMRENVTASYSFGTSDSTGKKDGVTSTTIINKKGQILPQTGSMGFLLFCVAGLLLVGVGAKMILSDRKRTIR